MATFTSLLVGTYDISSGVIDSGDIIYAYLCETFNCSSGTYIASSVGSQSLSYGGDTWTDTSNGTNCYDAGCDTGQFKIQFDYNSDYNGFPILFLVDSVNHGIIPQVGVGVNAAQVACNNFFECDLQTPNASFSIPGPTHTLSLNSSSTQTILDTETLDLSWTISETSDGYGNESMYWSDGGETTGVYVSGMDWTIKRGTTNLDETTYSDLTSNTSIEQDLTINFQPSDIINNVQSEQYTVKLKTKVTSLNDYNDGFFHFAQNTYTINVTNNNYITPITVCGDEDATNYVCLNTMYGADTDYCPNGGCDFGSCTADMWNTYPNVVNINNNLCNYQPGAVLSVTNLPGTLVVGVDGLGSYDDNGIILWEYNFNDGNIVNRNTGQLYYHTYTSTGTKTIELRVLDTDGVWSDIVTSDIDLNLCGCTDALADNYSSAANTEDGTCLYSGCSYTDAEIPFCQSDSCGFADGTLSCAMSWPCSGYVPETNSICLNTTPTYDDLSSVTDDGSCTFNIYQNPNYAGVITNYITDTENASNYITDTGITGIDLGHDNLDAQISSSLNSNYNLTISYFDDIRRVIEETECPDFCDPAGTSDASNSNYCSEQLCNSWHSGLMQDTDCTGYCIGTEDADGGCVPHDCPTHCASTYCDIGGASECCTSLGASGADSCTTAISCASQHTADWCDSTVHTCCSDCTGEGCCASEYTYNLLDATALAAQCLSSGNGYCDQCCEEGDCAQYYEDISTQFADVNLPVQSLGNSSAPTPSFFGFVADEPKWLDDALDLDTTFTAGDKIIGKRYDESDGSIMSGGHAPAIFGMCPPNMNLGANCDNFVCPSTPTNMWRNPQNCNNPNALRRLIPGRGYSYIGTNTGNLSFPDN